MIYDCTDYFEISGEGGGGGGSPPAPYRPIEANDTLASKQSLKMLFAISDNEIESIDQIYINGTPFSSFEGSAHTRLGTLDQATIPGFEDITTPIAVSVTLTTGVYITRAVSSSVVDAVRVALKLNGLQQVMENGDRVGYAVQLRIDTRPVAGTGTWTTAGTITKSGKASSVYGWDTRVNKPAGATGVWEFRVVRDTAADTTKQSSLTVFDSYTEIQDKKLTYPGTALVGLVFTNSEQLGGRIPTVSFDAKGWKMQLPDGAFYNPVTRVYTGIWSGAFDPVYKYSDNPSWFIYNILSTAMDRVINSKTYSSGLGISPSLIDKFSFYELAKYCDELVDDGHGSTEPRFIIANQFYVRENAPTFLAYCLTLCNANLTTQNGLITIISDRPTVSTKIVNNSNVIDGDFSYPSSHVNERYTQANVTFNDPGDKSNTRTVSEQASQTLIDRHGFNSIDIVLVGCRSEGQARRKAKWVLEAPTAMIGFSVGLAGAMYNVGEVVEVHDKSFTNLEGQGLVSVATTTQITLDRPVTFGAETYTVIVYGSDGFTIQEKIINQQNTTTNIITMTTALASAPAENSPWIIKGVVLPRKFRVSAITREDNEYKIVGTAYDETKYARLEGGIVVTPATGLFANLSEFETPAVSNITFQEFFRNDGISAANKILVKWDWDVANAQKFQPTYDVIWRRDNLPFQSLPSRQVKEAEILDTTPGIYEVIIYAVNVRGIRSIGTKQTYSYRVNAAQSSLIAPENFWVKSTTAATYNAADLVVTWTYPIANDAATDTLKDYLIEVWTADGITLKNTFTIKPNATRGGEFTYLIAQNTSDFGAPTRNVQLKIFSRDLIGDVSVALARVFSNPVPDAPTFTLVSGVGITFVSITPPADLDVEGYIIYRSTTAGFTPGPGNLVYDGPDTYISLQGADATLYYYKVAAYDNFSKTGLNVATQQSSTTLSFDATAWTKTGIDFTANTPTANTLYWSTGSIIKNGNTTYNIAAGNALWSSGTMYAYFNPAVSTTALQTTTSLATAVATGNYPLATYTGGAATNIKGGDGSAFISGSQIVAGTVGASQLIAGSAVITGSAQIANALINTAHINDGQITDAKIGNTIQSTNYNPTTFNGWKIDKAGNLTSYGVLNLFDAAGNAVLTTGAEAALQWAKVLGTGRPADNATVGADFDTNVTNIPYETIYSNDDAVALGFNSTFSNWTGSYPVGWLAQAGAAPVKETSIVRVGLYAVKYVATGANNYMYRPVYMATSPFPSGTFLSGTIDMYLQAYTSGNPGVLIRLLTNVGLTTYVDTQVLPSSTTTGVWQRQPFTARVGAGQIIYGMQIFIMGSWAGLSAGAFTGTVIFDNLRFALFDSTVDNKVVSIASDGTLSGAGGGQVSITGLGYTGDLNADVTDYLDTRVANAISENSVLSVTSPGGASYSGPINDTGAIKIRLPQLNSSTMLRFVVDIYNYVSGTTFSVEIGGYNDTTGWLNTSAIILGKAAVNYTIRFGHDGVKNCVWIGELATVWQYPKITVRDLKAGHSNYTVAQWATGWAISTETAFGTVQVTDADNLPHSSDTNYVNGIPSANVNVWNYLSGTGKPDDYATKGASLSATYSIPALAAATLTLSAGMTYSAGVLTKTGGTAGVWDAGAYSTTGITGGASVSCVVDSTVGGCMLGLNTDPATNHNYTSIDYALYLQGGGIISIYEAGLYKGVRGYYAAMDVFHVIYDGNSVDYYQNGKIINSTLVVIAGALYLDSSFAAIDKALSSVKFGAYVAPTLTVYSNMQGQITQGNVSTFISSAAIGNLQFDRTTGNKLVVTTADIQDLSVSTGKIQDLAVDTLQIAGNAVTIPVSATSTSSSVSVVMNSGGYSVIIIATCNDSTAPQNTQSSGSASIDVTGYGVVISEPYFYYSTDPSQNLYKLTPITLMHKMTPAAGSRTFTLNGFGNRSSILVMAVKK